VSGAVNDPYVRYAGRQFTRTASTPERPSAKGNLAFLSVMARNR
jgi:hypothetical protein